jgi:hypothetical protein
MAAGGLLSLMVSWSDSPIDRAAGLAAGPGPALLSRITPLLFGARGIAPVGYAAFGFALGVTAGVLIRRTVPAMAVTLVAFAVIQLIVPAWVRPHLIAPARATTALTAADINGVGVVSHGGGPGVLTVFTNVNEPGAWVLSNQTITAVGHAFTGPVPPVCNRGSFQACQASLGRLHLRQLITYQPASRFWVLQWYETAIFLALALALAGYCFWWIRRRRLS